MKIKPVVLILLMSFVLISSAKSQYKSLELSDTSKIISGNQTKLNLQNKPPLQIDNMALQFVGGNVSGVLVGIGGAFVGAGISKVGGSHGEYAGLGGAVLGFVVGHCAGSILGVYGIGSVNDVTGDAGATILGGIAGTGAGIGTLYAVKNEGVMWSTLTYPTIGAMVGFNSTLYYKDKKNVSELKDLGSHLKIKNDFEVEVFKVNFQLPKESEISKIPERFLLSLR